MASINTDTIAVSSTSTTSSQSITGNEFVVADNPVICSKASDDLSRNVSLNLKQKIIMGEYIDLALLVVNSQTVAAESQRLVFMKGELLVQQKQHKQIINIENWTDAILIFTSIYCSAHPATYSDMLEYIHTIRFGAKRSQGWKNYEEQFRLRKSQDPTSSWALIDQELWLLYLYSNPSNPNVSSLGSGYKFIPSIIKGIVQHSFVPTCIIVCAVMGNIPFLTVPGRILIQIGLGDTTEVSTRSVFA